MQVLCVSQQHQNVEVTDSTNDFTPKHTKTNMRKWRWPSMRTILSVYVESNIAS